MSEITPSFVHLRSHSEFSVVDGISRIPEMIKKAQAYGQPALALTDLCNLFGQIKFYTSARKAGLKAIMGCDIWLQNEEDREKPSRLLLLVQNDAGYLSLCDILTRAWLGNQYKGRAEVQRAWLKECSGLIALSGGRMGDVGQALADGNLELARDCARHWQDLFPGAFYIELQRSGADGDELYVQAAMRLAADMDLPVVATHPVQFISPDDFRAHEVRVCIAEGEQLANPKRVKRFTPEQYFLSTDDMQQRFADVPAALENTLEIAKRCNLEMELGKPYLPDFPTPEGMSLGDFLIQQAKEGLETRLLQLYADPVEREKQRPTYEERLMWECNTIISMGFPGYFLIVADFINWGKHNGVPVGPGRGSGRAPWWPIAWALPIWTPCAMTCCLNVS